jgi:hypothetical protein
MLKALRITGLLALVSASPARPAPSDDPQSRLQLVLEATSDALLQRYAVVPGPEDLRTPLQRLAVETRGPRPKRVASPPGWTSRISVAHHAMWGCEWRVEWQLEPGSSPATGPIDGFLIQLSPHVPSKYCHGELDFRNGNIYFWLGDDSVPRGIP